MRSLLLSGLLSLTLTSPGLAQVTIHAADPAAGAIVELRGGGPTTPTKHIRAQGGSFDVINDQFDGTLFSVDEAQSPDSSTVLINVNGVTKRVHIGGPDSCGTGYACLRIDNP